MATETFLRAHAEQLPGVAAVVYEFPPQIAGEKIVGKGFLSRAVRKVERQFPGGMRRQAERLFARVFARVRPDVVLAEYGMTGVLVMDACRRRQIPLVVHFHGFDASKSGVLDWHREGYAELFERAFAVVAVSRAMCNRLVSLGADPNRLHHIVYGVNCNLFEGAHPASAPPLFLACGRFVEKKAPQLTLKAFAEVARAHPEARLRMIGDGPLLPTCQTLAREMGIEDQIEFLGARSHAEVLKEMRGARAFVQHSIVAPDGDSEGTPVSVIEAGACGLPVIATRHAGIPDVVIEGETGLLVDEGDVAGMAERMRRLVEEPQTAGLLGKRAREHIQSHYSQTDSIEKLSRVLHSAAECGRRG
jgi:glycosyltransferase involved in cell wall biosynthesis